MMGLLARPVSIGGRLTFTLTFTFTFTLTSDQRQISPNVSAISNVWQYEWRVYSVTLEIKGL